MIRGDRIVLRLLIYFAVAWLMFGCGSSSNSDDPEPVPGMKVLHIVGGVGSFAYFQLLWPQVEVAQANAPTAAVIEPAASGFLFPGNASGDKEWLATSFAPWITPAGQPFPGMEVTAFLSGTNQTHTQQPTSNYLGPRAFSNIQSISAYQVGTLGIASPLVAVSDPFIGNAPGASAPVNVANAAGMIASYQALNGVDLTPTAAELALFGIPSATGGLDEFGRRLIVAAKALRSELSGSIAMDFLNDDPHGAFNDIPGLQNKLSAIKVMLNGFYTLLAQRDHADHVVITITGDTPKNPLARAGWPDGTPGGANWMYVVGKGYLKHGWFGRIHADGSVSGYDPVTGADDPARTSAMGATTTATAVVYAATRGDAAYIEDNFGGDISTYQGVVR